MKNNTFFGKIRGLLGKTLAIAMFSAVFAVASYAQTYSNNLYRTDNGAYFGQITVYRTHYHIQSGFHWEYKTFANSCRIVGSGASAASYCTWGAFSYGRQHYSGDILVYKSGVVYLRTLYEIDGTRSKFINGNWIGLVPK